MVEVTVRQFPSLALKTIEATPEAILQASARGLARGLQNTVAVAGVEYLTGPRPARLGVRTGKLRGGLTSEVVLVPDVSATGRLGDRAKYAAYHEFGFHGVVSVKSFTRISHVHKTFKYLGAKGIEMGRTGHEIRRAIRDRNGKVIGFKESNLTALNRLGADKLKNLGYSQGMVAAHTRRVNYAGRPYLGPALEKTLPQIHAEINREIGLITEGSK